MNLFRQRKQYSQCREDVLVRINELIPDLATAMEYELSAFNASIRHCTGNIYCSWKTPEFVMAYSRFSGKVIANLDAGIRRDSEARVFAEIPSRSLNPEPYNRITDEIELRRNQVIKPKSSNRYTCHKCGCKETTIQQVQIRAGDEGSNTKVTCLQCKISWITA